MADLSDTQIRANLRTLLSESGIDPNRTPFVCAGGTVRVLGRLLGLHDAPVQPGQVGELEQSIRRSPGVKRVHVDPENWERLPDGRWREREGRRERERRKSVHAEPTEEE